jgi:hypothetical protein
MTTPAPPDELSAYALAGMLADAFEADERVRTVELPPIAGIIRPARPRQLACRRPLRPGAHRRGQHHERVG